MVEDDVLRVAHKAVGRFIQPVPRSIADHCTKSHRGEETLYSTKLTGSIVVVQPRVIPIGQREGQMQNKVRQNETQDKGTTEFAIHDMPNDGR